MGLPRKSWLFELFRVPPRRTQDLNFTKNFGDDFVLTICLHRRRIFMPREMIAIAAVTSKGAQRAIIASRSIRWRPGF